MKPNFISFLKHCLLYNKKFWEELTVAYFPMIQHGLHREQKIRGDTKTHRHQGDIISLLTKIREGGFTDKWTDTDRQTAR
jgi:hypothetical protein